MEQQENSMAEQLRNTTEQGIEISNAEKLERRKQFLEVGQLLSDNLDQTEVEVLNDEQLGEHVQKKFQKQLEGFFTTSGLEDELKECKTDEEALHIIATKQGVSGWVDMLPKTIEDFNNDPENKGKKAKMNCTMTSAMLHIALEKMGYTKVRSAIMDGHAISLRELEDGSLKLYDANSRSTNKEGKVTGYTRTFAAEQIENRQDVEERDGRRGFSFTLLRGEPDKWGGYFHAPNKEGQFKKKMYVYDSSIKMDLAIALENLSEIEPEASGKEAPGGRSFIDEEDLKKRSGQARKIYEKYAGALHDLDAKKTYQQFGLFDASGNWL